MAKAILAEGDNYRVELDGDVALCIVWSRPDLDSETGARLAAQKVAICGALATGPALGLIFDLREAPKVTGPKTQQSLALLIGAWEAAARPLAIVVSSASLQKLQLTRIARDAGPLHAAIFLDLERAQRWLQRRLSERRTRPQLFRGESAAGAAKVRNSVAPAARPQSVAPAARPQSAAPAPRPQSAAPANPARSLPAGPAKRHS